MKLFLAIVALATVACADPEVSGKVAAILEHGGVEAHVECASDYGTVIQGSMHRVLGIHKFVDGSVLYSFFNDQQTGSPGSPVPARLCGRSESCSSSFEFKDYDFYSYNNGHNTWTHTVSGGVYSVVWTFTNTVTGHTSPETMFSDDVGDACTGFNLEAFE